jgi:ATP-binding cassette, subfamily B (MDR/TAP), member 1
MHFPKNLHWHSSQRSPEGLPEKRHHWTRGKTAEKEAGQHEDEKAPKETLPASVAYFRLWQYSSPLDWLLRAVGALAALGAGTAYPLMTIVFGDLVNDFNAIALGLETPAQFRHSINHNSLWFVYLFIGKFGVRNSI